MSGFLRDPGATVFVPMVPGVVAHVVWAGMAVAAGVAAGLALREGVIWYAGHRLGVELDRRPL